MNPKHLVPQSLRDRAAWILSRHELRRLMHQDSVSDVVRASFRYRGAGVFRHIYALQKESEILQLATTVQISRPRVIVEIGTAKGGTLFIWTRTNPQLDLIISIDLPGGDFGGGYDSKRTQLYQEFTYRHPNTQMLLLRCDSHSQTTFKSLQSILAGRAVDFLWIDGDHAYQGVKDDFQMYSTLLRPGGIIAFHDIVTKGDGHEVFKLWSELKPQYRTVEFVEDPSSNMGIGCIFL